MPQKTSNRFHTLLLARILVVVTCCSLASGQLGSSTIAGTVRDATDAPVPGAKVRVTNKQSGVTTDLVTNEIGAYRATAILSGTYTVLASAPGFDSALRTDIMVTTAQ